MTRTEDFPKQNCQLKTDSSWNHEQLQYMSIWLKFLFYKHFVWIKLVPKIDLHDIVIVLLHEQIVEKSNVRWADPQLLKFQYCSGLIL